MRRLLIRPGGIGDCILCFPAMEALRAGFNEVWVPRAVVPLVGFADRVRAISSTGLDMFGIPGVEPPPGIAESLGSFDEVVTWYGTGRSEFREALSAIVSSVRFMDALPRDTVGHAADFFAAQVGALLPAVPRIQCDPVANHSAWIHPFSGGVRKNWPYEKFQKLAAELERDLTVEWAETKQGVRFENLFELARHLAGSALYIGNDSGITHLAAAVGAPVLALFGPTDPRVWAPRGRCVRVLAEQTIDSLSVGAVLAAARELAGC